MKVKVAAESCLTLCNPMEYSPSGSSVHGILQARILEWVAVPFSKGSSQLRDWSQFSCIAGSDKIMSIGWCWCYQMIQNIYFSKFLLKKNYGNVKKKNTSQDVNSGSFWIVDILVFLLFFNSSLFTLFPQMYLYILLFWEKVIENSR